MLLGFHGRYLKWCLFFIDAEFTPTCTFQTLSLEIVVAITADAVFAWCTCTRVTLVLLISYINA